MHFQKCLLCAPILDWIKQSALDSWCAEAFYFCIRLLFYAFWRTARHKDLWLGPTKNCCPLYRIPIPFYLDREPGLFDKKPGSSCPRYTENKQKHQTKLQLTSYPTQFVLRKSKVRANSSNFSIGKWFYSRRSHLSLFRVPIISQTGVIAQNVIGQIVVHGP